eukprot:764418-Hanusia_phi.AAC.4
MKLDGTGRGYKVTKKRYNFAESDISPDTGEIIATPAADAEQIGYYKTIYYNGSETEVSYGANESSSYNITHDDAMMMQ